MIIEAYLADGAGPRRIRDLVTHDVRRARRILGKGVGLMRMDANREPHVRPQRFDLRRLPRFFRVAGREDDERPFEPRIARPRDDGLEIRCEDLVGEMAVGVNHLNEHAYPARAGSRTSRLRVFRPLDLQRAPCRSIRSPSVSPVSG